MSRDAFGGSLLSTTRIEDRGVIEWLRTKKYESERSRIPGTCAKANNKSQGRDLGPDVESTAPQFCYPLSSARYLREN